MFIPMVVLFFFSDSIFALFGFEAHVCAYAKTFLLYKTPYLYFYSIFDATKRLLYNTGYA